MQALVTVAFFSDSHEACTRERRIVSTYVEVLGHHARDILQHRGQVQHLQTFNPSNEYVHLCPLHTIPLSVGF